MTDQFTDMSQAKIEAFLQTPRLAVVGTNRMNGAPQLSPVWYLFENEHVYVSMSVGCVKHRNLQRDPRISLCVHGEHPDARGVMIYGTADLILDPDEAARQVIWRLIRRYHDTSEETQSYIDSMSEGEGSVLAVVAPDRILAQDYN